MLANVISNLVNKLSAKISAAVRISLEPDFRQIFVAQETLREQVERLEGKLTEMQLKLLDSVADRSQIELLEAGLAQGHVAADRQAGTLLARVERVRRELDFIRHHRNAYLGDGVSIVWLPDDTIMYLNSNDEGGPSALISGGLYEEDYFTVFRSFLSPESLVLDIGANLGIYSLRTAQMFRNAGGRIIAFEPHPFVFSLFSRSIKHNGLQNQIEAHNSALSDTVGEVELFYPAGHIGGGGYQSKREGSTPIRARLKVLDDLLPTQKIDLVKLDVEGNELSVLRGMRNAISRSLSIAILFEKLQANSAEDEEQYDLLASLGLSLYAVEAGSQLRLLDAAGYRNFSGYSLAARENVVGEERDRRFFKIGWRQLHFPDGQSPPASDERSTLGGPGGVLFHGPYWYLPRGRYRLSLQGRLDAPIQITIAEQFGVEVVKFVILPDAMSGEFETPYDLRKFECVARPDKDQVRLVLQNLKLQQF